MKRLLLVVALVSIIALSSLALAQTSPPYIPGYDVNEDYTINIQDIMLVASHWGATSSPLPTPEVRIRSTNVISDAGSAYLVGEIENGSSTTIDNTRINVALYAENGHLVYADDTYSMIRALAPGDKSPFRFIWFDLPSWTSYETATVHSIASTPPITFEVVSQSSSFDAYDDFHVTGQVRNQYGQAYNYVEAFVTMYDQAGEVIGVDYDFVAPDTLAPGATGVFDVEIFRWKGKPDHNLVANYTLQVRLD